MRSGVVHTLPLVEQKSDPSSESRAFHDRSCVSAAAPFRFFSRPPLLARSLSFSIFFSIPHLGRDRVEEVPDALLAARLDHSGSRERLHESLARLAVADALPERFEFVF